MSEPYPDDPVLAAVHGERDSVRDARWLAMVDAALARYPKSQVAAALGMPLSNFTPRLDRTRQRVEQASGKEQDT